MTCGLANLYSRQGEGRIPQGVLAAEPVTHASRYLRRYQRSGHVWQRRFRCFPIQEDEHLLTVLRSPWPRSNRPARTNAAGSKASWPARKGWACRMA
jgi:hypothetical protein